ncbi:MAG: pilus assembly protein PapD, partial [Stenotrophomonas maltophilia]
MLRGLWPHPSSVVLPMKAIFPRALLLAAFTLPFCQ